MPTVDRDPAIVRDALRGAALTAETWVALWAARRLIDAQPRAIWPMMVASAAPVGASDRAIASRVARAVARAARVVPRASCLVRAVAAYRILARRGVSATLCLGAPAERVDGRFTGHAWLELGGAAVVGDPSPTRFARSNRP